MSSLRSLLPGEKASPAVGREDSVPDVWPPIAGGQVKTMSSMEIAEITGKGHKT